MTNDRIKINVLFSCYKRSFSCVGNNVVKPVSSLVIQYPVLAEYRDLIVVIADKLLFVDEANISRLDTCKDRQNSSLVWDAEWRC